MLLGVCWCALCVAVVRCLLLVASDWVSLVGSRCLLSVDVVWCCSLRFVVVCRVLFGVRRGLVVRRPCLSLAVVCGRCGCLLPCDVCYSLFVVCCLLVVVVLCVVAVDFDCLWFVILCGCVWLYVVG